MIFHGARHRRRWRLLAAVGLGAMQLAMTPMQSRRTVRARIIMPDGTAAQSVRVRFEEALGEAIKDGFTDPNGVFEVGNLNVGNYVVSVPSDGRVYEAATERIELNRLSPDTVSLNVYLVAKGEVSTRTGARRTTSVK